MSWGNLRVPRFGTLCRRVRKCRTRPQGQQVGVAQNILATNLVVEQVEAELRFRLRLTIEPSLKGPDLFGCFEAHRQSPILTVFESVPEVRSLPSTGITRVQQYYAPVRLPPDPPPYATLKPRPPIARVSPVTRITVPACRAHYPGGSDGCVCRL